VRVSSKGGVGGIMTPTRKKRRNEGRREIGKSRKKDQEHNQEQSQDASQWDSNQTLTGTNVLEMLVSYMIENLYLCRVDTMIQNRTITHTIVKKRQNNHAKRASTKSFVLFLSKTDSLYRKSINDRYALRTCQSETRSTARVNLRSKVA
jgi:hypothetical protein